MIGTLIGLILTLVVVGVVIWGVLEILKTVPLPPQFAVVIRVLVVIVCVLVAVWVIAALLGVAGVPVRSFW
jgi:hypothetical protein